MSVATALAKAADKMTGKGAYVHGFQALTKDRMPVEPGDAKAVCWSLPGALLLVAESADEAAAALDVVRQEIGRRLNLYTDGRYQTQAAVVALVRKCAAAADKARM